MIRVFSLFLTVMATALVSAAAEPPLKIVLQEKEMACVQASRVTADFPALLQGQLTNQVRGLVLDLRFADGDKAVPTLDFPPTLKSPVIVLVNAGTQGAAAELAARLRTTGRAILIGGTNVTGSLAPDITITASGDEEKKYQANPYALPDTNSINTTNQTWLPFIDRTSEADLVRRRAKDGDEDLADAPRARSETPVIRDPALARAMDLLTALAVLRPPRG